MQQRYNYLILSVGISKNIVQENTTSVVIGGGFMIKKQALNSLIKRVIKTYKLNNPALGRSVLCDELCLVC